MPEERGLDAILADFVLKRGLATAEEVRQAMDLADRKGLDLGGALVELGHLTEVELADLTGGKGAGAKGIRIGGFEIIEKVGQGGMGAVYRARQLSLDREVALKILPRNLAADPEYVGRFLREARASAKLNHLNIVQGIDVGEADGYFYFAMEFVDGVPVARRIRHEGPIPEAETVEILLQMARALGHASAHGLVHRDVKPDNIMLDRHGVAKLCDLGLATVPEKDAAKSGVAIGTPNYISPEQARGEEDIDVRADIYGLGASAYHMLTGQVMFSGSAQEVLAKHVSAQAPSPRAVNASVSDQACFVLEKMLAKRAKDRYQTAAELVEDLERLKTGVSVTAAKFTARSSLEPTPRTVDVADIGRRVSGRRQATRGSAPAVPAARARTLGYVAAAALGAALAVAAIMVVVMGGRRPDGPSGGPGGPAAPGPVAVGPGESPGPAQVDHARSMYEYAEEFERTNPAQRRRAAAKYREVASAHPQSDWGRRASERADELERMDGEALKAALDAAAEMVRSGKFAEARKAYDAIPAAFEEPGLAGKVAALKEQAELSALERFARLAMDAFEVARDKGDFPKAEEMLVAAKAWGVARVDAKVDERLKEIAALKEKIEGERLTAAERERKARERALKDRYEKASAEAGKAFSEGRFADAQAAYRAILADKDLAAYHARAAAWAGMASDALFLSESFAKAVGAIPAGTKLDLRTRRGIAVKGSVTGSDGGRITVRDRSGANVAVGADDLTPEDLAVVAEAAPGGAESAARLKLGAAVALVFSGELERARASIALARSARPPDEIEARLRLLSDEIDSREIAALDAEAESLITKMRDGAKAGDHAAVLAAYKTLTARASKTAALAKASAEVEKLAEEARAAASAVAAPTDSPPKQASQPAAPAGKENPAEMAKAIRDLVLRKVLAGPTLKNVKNSGDQWAYGSLLADIGQTQQAVELLDKFMKNPRGDWSVSSGRAQLRLAQLYVMLGRPDLAKPLVADAKGRSNEDWFQQDITRIEPWLDKYPDCVKELDALYAERSTKGPSAELQWSICDALRDKVPRALEERAELEAMVRLYPDHASVKSGDAHWRLLEGMEKFREYDEIVKLAPGHITDHPKHWSVTGGQADWTLGESHYALGRWNDALNCYRDMLRNHTDHWVVRNNHGQAIQDRIGECNRRLR